ncbi:hypothetical protein KUTeg_003048, partial [Tegillarca granosa]
MELEEIALSFSLVVQSDLRESGFLLADEKCNAMVWLGLYWNFKEEQRVNKLLISITKLLERIGKNPCIPLREIACVTGQIISMHTAVGKASWNASIMVSQEARSELIFWLNNITKRNGQYIDCFTEFDYRVYSDASSTGYGGFIVENEKYEIFGSWSHLEMSESSTWRELEAVKRILFSCENCPEGQYIQWYTDNKSVVSIIEKGSMKPQLQEKAIDIHNVCEAKNVSINPVWVPRSNNRKADMLSRVSDSEDWYGPHTCDRFASHYNTKCSKFNSKWWCPGTSGVDAFMHSWCNELNWLVPPPRLISRVVDKSVTEKSKGTLVIPLWRSAPYWPKVHDGSMFMSFIKDHRILSSKIVCKGRGNNGIFGDKKSLSLTSSILEDVSLASKNGTVSDKLQDLAHSIVNHLVGSRSDNTIKNYFSAFKKWQTFANSENLKAIPAEPIHVALFLTDLMNKDGV